MIVKISEVLETRDENEIVTCEKVDEERNHPSTKAGEEYQYSSL